MRLPHRRGLTLVEVIVAITVLSLVMLGVMAAQSGATLQREMANETQLARRLALAFIESLRSKTLEEVHDLTPDQDGGPDTTTFDPPAAAGLLVDLDPTATLRFVRVTDEGGDQGKVGNSAVDTFSNLALGADEIAKLKAELGLPLDLNMEDTDGNANFTDDGVVAGADLRLLPVWIRIEWSNRVNDQVRQRRLDYYVVLGKF